MQHAKPQRQTAATPICQCSSHLSLFFLMVYLKSARVSRRLVSLHCHQNGGGGQCACSSCVAPLWVKTCTLS